MLTEQSWLGGEARRSATICRQWMPVGPDECWAVSDQTAGFDRAEQYGPGHGRPVTVPDIVSAHITKPQHEFPQSHDRSQERVPRPELAPVAATAPASATSSVRCPVEPIFSGIWSCPGLCARPASTEATRMPLHG